MSLCKNLSQKCVRLAAIIPLLAVFALAAQAQVVFSPPKNISNSSRNTQAQQVAVDSSGNVNVVWADNSLGNYAIFFSRSSDSGNTFSTPVSISKHAQSTASVPRIALDSSGNISIVWTETSPDGSLNFVYFSHSSNGASFTNPQNISGDAGAATGPQIAVESGGGIDVVWVDTSLGNSEIFFSRSTDGATFSAPLNISNDSGDSVGPKIAVDPAGNINVGWSDDTPGVRYDVFFSRSSDGGASFSGPLQITHSNQFVIVSGFSQIAAGANGSIYLLWIQHTPFSAFALFSRSTNGGATFSTPIGAAQIAGFSFATSAAMALDPSGNDIGVVAPFFDTDESGGSGPFFGFGASTDGGASFPTGFLALENGTSNPAVQIAADVIGRFDIVDSFSGSQYPYFSSPCLCFEQSADGSEFTSASISSYATTQPLSMALDAGGNVSVAWLQSTSSGGSANVFFSRGTVVPFSLTVLPKDVIEGGSSTGTVRLVAPSAAGGTVISLSNSNPSAASIPASVTVPQGTSRATFAISANPVPTSASAAISGSLNGRTSTIHLNVHPLFLLQFFGNMTGGNTASGEVSLGQPAPTGGLVISLSSSDSTVASVPPSVTVPAGSEFALFNVSTSPVAAPTTVQITGAANGFTHSGAIAVQPARIQQLSVSPTTAVGTSGSTGTVTLTGPAASGGAVVSLSSSDPSASVPGSVTIPAGATSASFSIATNPGSSTTNVTVSASYNGATLTTILTVQPLVLQQVTLFRSSVGGGGTVTGQVVMNVRLTSGSAVVSLSSSNPSISSVPASVTIPAGSISAQFSVNTSSVSSNTDVSITASYNGVTVTSTITIQPIMLTQLAASDIPAGTSNNYSAVVLNGPAPAGGAVVSLSSSNPSLVSVPASVTIPQGSSFQNFTITASSVTAPTPVTITASYNGVTLSRTITVH